MGVAKALFETLTADSALTGLLGGAKIYDDVPRDTEFPYLVFGQSLQREWSTGTDDAAEHLFTLHVWSRANGRRETHEIMDVIRGRLQDAVLTLDDHRLINLRHEFSDARRGSDGETYQGILRYRAVTEPVS